MKKIIIPKGSEKPLAPYSPGIQWDERLLFTAGQIGLKDGKLVEGGVRNQARQALENLKLVLEAGNANLNTVMKVTVFVTTMDDYAAVNEVYGRFFIDNPPARSAVAVYQLPLGALVEIEAVAHVLKK